MKLIWLALFVFYAPFVAAANLRVALIVPDQETQRFWQQVVDFAQAVAEDHNIHLDIHYSDTNRFAFRTTIENILQQANKPDYLIFRPMQGTAVEAFSQLDSLNIGFVTLEQGLSDAELDEVGLPQQKYPNWLGAVVYDDADGGAQLTAALHKRHLQLQPDSSMYMTAIAGGFERLSLIRQSSLNQLPLRRGPIVLNQIFPMSWSVSTVQQNFPAIYDRYPDTDAYWCVSDAFALTISAWLNTHQAKTNPLIGGFDWLPEAISAIEQGKITASVGGHFLMAGKALLKIIAYQQGDKQTAPSLLLEKYELIDQDNVADYQAFLQQAPWAAIDYRQFSRASQATPPELSISNMIKAFAQTSTAPQ